MQLFHGNCLDKLRKLPDNSVDSIVTDPPYGLSFMGKRWDYDVPSSEIWKEALRVLKPGGHLLAFFGTRTYHRGVTRIEDAGFEIRDCIQWIYGSGFPKSHNLKTDDGTNTGWGTALKPANEPIVVARKPLVGTVAENVAEYGTGAINIDGCRIEAGADLKPVYSGAKGNKQADYGDGTVYGNSDKYESTVSSLGRWPANVIFDEAAAEMLDEQSGVSKSNVRNPTGGVLGHHHGQERKLKDITIRGIADSGGASRFFYVAKASKRERNAGLEGMPLKKSGIKNASGRGFSETDPHKKIYNQNHHPTVKPIKLMEYLCKLVTPANGTVLDPFMGSGSTGVAAKNLGFKFVGIELSKEYFKIAKKRVSA